MRLTKTTGGLSSEVPIAGALYDNAGGWQSMSMAHLVCQGPLGFRM